MPSPHWPRWAKASSRATVRQLCCRNGWAVTFVSVAIVVLVFEDQMIRSFLFALLLTMCGCTEICTPGQTRCVNNSAQVCLANGQWREFERCPDVAKQSGGTWQCAASSAVDGGVTCLGSPFCTLTEPTPELVQTYWSYMENVYQSKRIAKSSAPEMQ